MKLKKSTWISMSAAVVVVVGVIVFLATGNKPPQEKIISMGILDGSQTYVMTSGSGVKSDILGVSKYLDGIAPNEFTKADTEKKSIVMEFSDEKPINVNLRYYKDTDATTEQEYPINTTNYEIKLPSEAGNYTFLADVTWKDGTVNTAFFSANIKADEVVDNTTKTDDTTKFVYDEYSNHTSSGHEANLFDTEKEFKLEEAEDGKSIELINPVDYTRVAADYGWRKVGDIDTFHNSVDLAAPESTDIYAAADGEVIFAEWDGSYGNKVVIKHDDDYETVYAHCKTLTAKKGDMVKQGDVISTVGTTGYATGNHLHFELRKEGKPMPPGIGIDIGTNNK